jgi:hypothetical protein
VRQSSARPITYVAAVKKFNLNDFCDTWSIDEEARMPASATLITAFVAEYYGLNSGNTICTLFVALGMVMMHGVHLARLSANKNGTAHIKCPSSCASLHLIELLLTLHHNITLSNPFHASIMGHGPWALTTFFGCRRLREITLKITCF